MLRFFCAALGLLASANCTRPRSSGLEDAMMPDATADAETSTGWLAVTAQPDVPDLVCEVWVDQVKRALLQTTETVLIAVEPQPFCVEVEACTLHRVRLVCPGYGYAAPGYEFSTDEQAVEEWVMTQVRITNGQTTRIQTTVCRDLTGQWQRNDEEMDRSEVFIETTKADGRCWSVDMPAYDFLINGDFLTVLTGPCEETTVQISTAGDRIEVNCGFAWTDVFVKVE